MLDCCNLCLYWLPRVHFRFSNVGSILITEPEHFSLGHFGDLKFNTVPLLISKVEAKATDLEI